MTAADDERDRLLGALRVAPRLLREMTRDLDAAQAWTAPRPGEWSAGEVVRHLAAGDADTFVPRLERMLAEDRPTFAPAPPGERPRDLAGLLDVFAAARGRAVALLAGLDDPGWQRTGVSPSRGALSVEAYARSMAAHDTEHRRQIQDVRAALGVMPRRCEAGIAVPFGELLPALAATPARLRAIARDVPDAALRRRPAAGEWCLNEIMAHLLHVETTLFLPRLRRMATEDAPVFEPFSPEPWARERDHSREPFATSLAAFERAREETVAFLAALPPGAAERRGLSGFFGPLTLGQYATHAADHDLEHVSQMRAALHAAGHGAPVAEARS